MMPGSIELLTWDEAKALFPQLKSLSMGWGIEAEKYTDTFFGINDAGTLIGVDKYTDRVWIWDDDMAAWYDQVALTYL